MLTYAIATALLTVVNPPAGQVLVSLSGEHSVALIDVANGRRLATFAAVAAPHEIAVSADGRLAFVANSGAPGAEAPGHHVTVIDLRTRAVRQIDVAPHRQPHDVRVSRDGRLLWVAVAPSRAVLEVDVASGKILRTLPVERDGAWFVAATPDGRKLYVPFLEGKGLAAIERERATSRVLISGTAFSGAEVSPDGSQVWAVEHEARRIHVVSTANDQVLTQIPLDTADFARLQFSPDGRRVFVVQGKRLQAFDADTRRLTATVEMPLDGKVIAISRDGAHAALSNPSDNKVTIVDLAAMRVISSVAAGAAPDGVAWVDAGLATETQQGAGCALAREYLAAADQASVERMLALFADGARYEDVTFGFSVGTRREIGDMLKNAFESTRGFTRTVSRDESGAAIEWSATGTHAAPMLGIAPTGRTVTIRAVSLLRVAAGMIQGVTDYTDRAGLEKDLGVRR